MPSGHSGAGGRIALTYGTCTWTGTVEAAGTGVAQPGSLWYPDLFANPAVAAMSDDDIADILANGIEGTAMAAFGDRLSDAEIGDLVALIRSWQAGE